MIDRKKFWSTSKKMLTYDNIQKIETSQVDDDIIGGLLDYVYFKSYYEIIAIYVNNKYYMLFQKQYNKSILQKI